jgi:hypothetical protein
MKDKITNIIFSARLIRFYLEDVDAKKRDNNTWRFLGRSL